MYHQPAVGFVAVTRGFSFSFSACEMPYYLVITLAASKVGLRAHQVFRRNATQLQLSEFRTVDATLEFFFPAHRAVLQLLKVCSLLFVKVTDCTS